MSKIPQVTAQAEVDKWLEAKKITGKKLDSLKDNVEALVDGIEDGSLVLREDMHFVLKLKFPLTNSDGKETLTELVFKPRLTIKEVNARMKGVKPSDADARVIRYVGALTDQPSAVLENLDTGDNAMAQQFASFFL